MPIEDTAILGINGINIILTIVLLIIYFRNYRSISSRITLGLMLFAGAFLLECVMNFFFYNSLLQQGITGLTTFNLTVNMLEFVALSFLIYATWK